MGSRRGTSRPEAPRPWWHWTPEARYLELRAWLDGAHAAGFKRLSIRDDPIPGCWTATVSDSPSGTESRTYDLGASEMAWLWDWWPEHLREAGPGTNKETLGWLVGGSCGKCRHRCLPSGVR
jgi:hypothetical protein